MAWARLHRELRVEGRRLELRVGDVAAIEATVRRLPLLSSPEPSQMADACYHEAVRLFTEDREDEAVELLRKKGSMVPTKGKGEMEMWFVERA